MSSLTQIVRQARELLESRQAEIDPAAGDVDYLTDAQLERLAGPGYPEVEDFLLRNGPLPANVMALDLLGQLLQAMERTEPAEVRHLSDAQLEAIAREATNTAGPLTDEQLEDIVRGNTP